MKKNNSKQVELFVEGMHCASCEILIEKKLLKNKGIKAVDASLGNGKVTMIMDKDINIEIDEINRQFKTDEYTFSKTPRSKKEEPFIKVRNGSIKVNKRKAAFYSKAILIALVFLAGFFFIEHFQLGQYISVDNNSTLGAFFLLGIVAAVSSCAALVGGLLLSMAKSWHEQYITEESISIRARPHIMFHIGRLISFMILGGVLGTLGGLITLDNPVIYSGLVFFVSLIMALLGLQMLGVSWANKIKLSAPKSLLGFATDDNNFKGKYMPFSIGAMTFFLPCGFTLIAQAMALASGGFVRGSLIMTAFALGTLPALSAISYSSLKFTTKPHLTAKFNVFAGLIVLFFVAYNINGQLNVLGLPSLNDINLNIESSQNQESMVVQNGDEQIISFIAQGFEYIPTNGTTFKAGVPTKFVVENKGIAGCGAYLAATGLVNGYLQLKPGLNEVEIANPRAGTYKVTCTMGMVPPVIIKII